MRSTTTTRAFGIVGGLLAFCTVNCSKAPHATPQNRPAVEMPAVAPAADPLEGRASGSYRGSALLFDAAPPIAALQTIMRETSSAHAAKADWLQFRRREIIPRSQAVSALSAQLQDTEKDAQSGANQAAAQDLAARHWFGEQLTALIEAGVALDNTSAGMIWGAYCEAKIWELALSPKGQAVYTRRPSPLAFCEDYYDSAKLLTGPSCQPEAEGRSYWACLWEEGVAKTGFFAGRYAGTLHDRPKDVKSVILTNWMKDGTLAAALTSSDRAVQVVNAALNQERLKVSKILGKDYKDAFVPDSGTPDVTSPQLPLRLASPAQLLAAMEDGEAAVAAQSLHLAATQTLDTMAAARLTALHSALRLFAQRPAGLISASDFMFNHPKQPEAEPSAMGSVRQHPGFASLFAAMTPEAAANIANLRAQLASRQADLNTKTEAADLLLSAYTSHLRASAIAASGPGVSTALWINATLHTASLDDSGIMALTLQLDDQSDLKSLRACWRASDGVSVPCPPPPTTEANLLSEPDAKASHDATTSVLSLTTPMHDPAALGLKAMAVAKQGAALGDPFVNLAADDLRDKALAIELYPNRLGDDFYFYSGKVRISDADGNILHEGAMDLMAEPTGN